MYTCVCTFVCACVCAACVHVLLCVPVCFCMVCVCTCMCLFHKMAAKNLHVPKNGEERRKDKGKGNKEGGHSLSGEIKQAQMWLVIHWEINRS